MLAEPRDEKMRLSGILSRSSPRVSGLFFLILSCFHYAVAQDAVVQDAALDQYFQLKKEDFMQTMLTKEKYLLGLVTASSREGMPPATASGAFSESFLQHLPPML